MVYKSIINRAKVLDLGLKRRGTTRKREVVGLGIRTMEQKNYEVPRGLLCN